MVRTLLIAAGDLPLTTGRLVGAGGGSLFGLGECLPQLREGGLGSLAVLRRGLLLLIQRCCSVSVEALALALTLMRGWVWVGCVLRVAIGGALRERSRSVACSSWTFPTAVRVGYGWSRGVRIRVRVRVRSMHAFWSACWSSATWARSLSRSSVASGSSAGPWVDAASRTSNSAAWPEAD